MTELICSRFHGGDKGKWLIFVNSKAEGNATKERLNAAGISAAFVAADGMDEVDQAELNSILAKGKFSVQVLLATDVLDNGISINDICVTHLLVSGFEQIRAVQQAGRIRVKSRQQQVELFLPQYSAEAFNRKRFQYVKKLKAYHVFTSGDEEKIKSYLIQYGNDALGGIVYQGKNGGWYANDFAGKALEYVIDELSDNIARLREDSDGYIKKALGWFGLPYDPEGDQRRKNQIMAEDELKKFLDEAVNRVMTGKNWEDFRQRLRELYESVTREKLCSGRSDRQVGVATIKKIILPYGYMLERDKKNYKIKKETNPICST